MNKIHIGIAIFISMLFIGCTSNETSVSNLDPSAFDNNTATIEIKRKPNIVDAVVNMDININGMKQATIANGETKNVYFVPSDNGNTLIGIFKDLGSWISDSFTLRSKPLHFQVRKGDMISIVCEAKYINLTGKPVLICDLNKEKNQSIDIDKNSTLIQAQSEIVKLTTGVVVKTKKSRTIEHSIELLEATTLESKKDYKSSIPSPISILLPNIRKEVERKLGQSFKQSETIEQEVELDGNIHRQYKLVWYDKVRRGRINFIENGKTIQIPFQFKEWSELKVEDVEP